MPEGKTFHSPFGPPSKSSAFVPLQYSTWYVEAYGLAHWIRTALIGFSTFKSTITHCGCWVSLSPVNLLVRIRITLPIGQVRTLNRAIATGREAAMRQRIRENVASRLL